MKMVDAIHLPVLADTCVVGGKKRLVGSGMCLESVMQKGTSLFEPTKYNPQTSEVSEPVLPGLSDDVAKYCLALVPRYYLPIVGSVCKRWQSLVQSRELSIIRKHAMRLDEWIYVLCTNKEGKGSHWEVLSPPYTECRPLPLMPGPLKAAFGIVTLDSKLLVMAGHVVGGGPETVSADVYQYDSRLNRWSSLASMNVARYDFACAEVDGMVYVVGGYGANGENLCSAEVYDPSMNKWAVIESMRRPRWGCFACGFEGKLYVMGGRSSFTIGNSRFVDVYNPKCHSWCEMKNGCAMVTAHAVLGKKLFCLEWKNQRKLSIFSPDNNSWKMVPLPVTGSSCVGFQFGVLDGKLLLFPMGREPGYRTLVYDPDAAPGLEWKTSSLRAPTSCLCSVTINA